MAKVKLIETSEKFVGVLERSQLFAPNQLEAIKLLAETAEDPVQIARALLKNGWVTKWQASQMLSGFYQLTIGKYRLSDQLGKGELGNVYLAENPKLGRKVALKTLSKKYTGDPELVKRFLNEAKAAAALDHRNIVHVHDVSSEGQRHYVVMEYVSGRDLQSRITADGQLSIADATSFIRQAAAGLQHAHEQGVIHRDVKPANIIVDDQGIAKILDIGVGHLRKAEKAPAENTGELMMSAVAYMAPEHARGQNVDARCDIYSLGAVFYFLLTARAPFTTKTDTERAKIKESKRPIPLSELRAGLPQPLVDLCDRMMQIKPDDRFASMADVLAALASADDLTSDVAASAEDTELAEAEPDVIEMAVLEAEVDELATNVKTTKPESSAESKPAVPAFSINLAGAASPASSVAVTGFAINTKQRKKKPAAGPTPVAKEAAAAPVEKKASQPVKVSDDSPTNEDEALPVIIEPKKGLSKVLIIGGACAAGLLLMVGSGVGALMLFGGGDKEVAQAVPGATVAVAETPSDARESDDAAETTASTIPAGASDVAEVVASTDATAAAPSTTAPDPFANDVTDVKDASPTVVAEVAGSVAVTAPAAPAVAPMAEPTPSDPAPEKPAETKPEEKKPEPESTTEPTKPPESKPEPKVKSLVFEPAVDLPTPAADAPELTLGQVNIDAQDAVFISLDGGDIAAAGRSEFSVQNAQDGVAPRDWEFIISDAGADPVVIATMSMPEKDLKFKWTPAGVENATATNLRNCSLKITAGQDQPHDLALRKPQTIAPFTIELEKSATAKLPLEGAPDRSSLRLEVTVNGHSSMVEPSQIDLGKGGDAIVYFGDNQEQAAFALKLNASVSARSIQVKTDPHFVVPGGEPVRMNKASIKKYEAAQNEQDGLQKQVFEGEKAFADPKLPAPQKQRIQGVLAEMKLRLELVNKTVAKMAQLKTDMAAIGTGASLQFRVYSDTFEKQIDLVVTDPNAAPVAP